MILTPIFFNPGGTISISVDPTSFGESVAGSSGTTSGSAVVTITGGLAPYNITWTSSNANIAATNPTSTTTTFDYAGLISVLDFETAVVEIYVQDANLNEAFFYYSASVTRTS